MWRQACAVLGAFAIAAPALAEEPANGFYTGFNLGIQDAGKVYTKASLDLSQTAWQIFTPNNPIPVPMDNSVVKFKPGGLTSLFLGYRFNPNWRADFQVEYAYDSIDDLLNPYFGSLDGMPGYGFSARHTHVVGFFNFMYDAASVYQNTGRDPGWVPYIGGGLGAGRFRDWYTLANDAGLEALIKFAKNRYAGQAIVGFNYYFDSYTNFFMDYRYQSTIGKVPDLGKRYATNTLGFGMLFNLSNM